MYSQMSESVQNDNGADRGLLWANALQPAASHCSLRTSLSPAIVPTNGTRPVFLPYARIGRFFMTSQHRSDILNGASTRKCHFFEIERFCFFPLDGLIPPCNRKARCTSDDVQR